MPKGNPKPEYAGLSPEDKQKAYIKTYYEKNKEARQAYGRKQSKEYREKNREVVLAKKLDQWLRINFKRTTKWYEETLVEQSGHCALCESLPIEGRRFQVDHSHKCCPTTKTYRKTCGKCVRGLLCEGCNTALGHLETFLAELNINSAKPGSWTSKALGYLESYEGNWKNDGKSGALCSPDLVPLQTPILKEEPLGKAQS